MGGARYFGEWLEGTQRGRGLRLVIEEMSERSMHPSIAGAVLRTEPAA